MASTYTTTKTAAGVQPKSEHQGVVAVRAVYTLLAALVINDVIQMIKIPKGAQILEIILGTDKLDTNGTPTILLNVGDSGLTDRFIKQSTIAQAGGVIRLGSGIAATLMSGANGYQYTAAGTIDVLVQAAPATGAVAGDITLTVLYQLDA